MRRFGHFVVLLACVLIACVCGCARDLPIELLKLESVLPRAVERGDHLEIRGSGFPQGRTATITLRGTLHRPGAMPEAATIVTDGTVTAPEHIDVLVDERLESLLCGNGADADHTTFHGEIEVTFASHATSSAAVGATLGNLTLDAHPAVMDSLKLVRELESGQKTLEFLGIDEVDPTAGGLVVRRVTPGSRADTLGASAGDVITSWGGLKTLETRDLSASAMGPLVAMTFLRVSGREETHEVNVVGLSGAAPPDLSLALVIMAIVAAFACLFVLPLRVPFAGLEATLAPRARRMMRLSGPAAWVPAMVALFVAVVTLMPPSFVEEIDVPLSVSAILAFTLLDAVERGAKKNAIFRTVGAGLVVELGPLVALAALGVASSGIGLFDAARTQGALPWHWVAFKSPIALAAVVLVGASRLARPDDSRGGEKTTAFGALAASLTAFVLAFEAFGGGAVARAQCSQSVSTAALAGMKTWLLAVVLLSLPRLGAALGSRLRARLAWKWPLGASFVLVAAALACVRLHALAFVRERTAEVLVIVVVALLARAAVRLFSVRNLREPHADPFI
jgi:hypothetical protein